MTTKNQVSILLLFTIVVATTVVTTGPLQAEIVGVSGPGVKLPNGNTGPGPMKIPAPTDALGNCVLSGAPGMEGMVGFDEAQGVVTTLPYTHDSGAIPVGTRVDSHMIFLNRQDLGVVNNNPTLHQSVVWTFDGLILGVMSSLAEGDGSLEANSSLELGAPGTNYTNVPSSPNVTSCGTNVESGEQAAPFPMRGIEQNNGCVAPTILSDGYTIQGNQLTVCMLVNQPGDWIRVITAADPPGTCEDGKPVKLVFEYTGQDCSASNNTQDADTCFGNPFGAEPVRVAYTGKFGNQITVSPSTETIKVGSRFSVEATDRRTVFSTTKLEIRQGASVLQETSIHTSCSQPIAVGDQFGSLILRDYIAASKPPKGKK